ncbi:MAG TPA: hypothetical protein VD963_08225 [Phycisphaerales bacterium]|nr:hypothetical protein [Phycisphaerales bacterium]
MADPENKDGGGGTGTGGGGGGAGSSGGGSGTGEPALPTPAQRAEAAAAQVAELSRRLARLEEDLAKARAALAESEQRRKVAQLLIEAGTTDMDAAAALIEKEIAGGATDLAALVRELRRRKPHLFAPAREAHPGGAMSARWRPPPGDDLEEIAGRAASTGDRALLLRYLRLRRGR